MIPIKFQWLEQKCLAARIGWTASDPRAKNGKPASRGSDDEEAMHHQHREYSAGPTGVHAVERVQFSGLRECR